MGENLHIIAKNASVDWIKRLRTTSGHVLIFSPYLTSTTAENVVKSRSFSNIYVRVYSRFDAWDFEFFTRKHFYYLTALNGDYVCDKATKGCHPENKEEHKWNCNKHTPGE